MLLKNIEKIKAAQQLHGEVLILGSCMYNNVQSVLRKLVYQVI